MSIIRDDVARLFTSCMTQHVQHDALEFFVVASTSWMGGKPRNHLPWTRAWNDGYEDIRKAYPEYLSACAAFLSLPRSAHIDARNIYHVRSIEWMRTTGRSGWKEQLMMQERRDLNDTFSVCTCTLPFDASDRLLESLHRFKPTRHFTLQDFVQALVRHLSGILNDAVESRTVAGITALGGLKRNRRKHAGSLLWPMTASQLMPHGLERLIEGYMGSFGICVEERFPDIFFFFFFFWMAYMNLGRRQ
ncbi:uncharacterized protein C8Q71DRAFT_422332 [Rhodofomes roseus]|uniref:Uncharacterized protein n=1 Tax=Rhodofomes roseus TaxID=34475 RepID=A0ABQ8KQ60_9APHY|nr:uncharacterized protein C8Q71DRAFT_422332 [Rhodofomes roseus]KAH9840758.1 hypothetical protein C8Q71DRAFT_422332 [Rhodofomes roseus]